MHRTEIVAKMCFEKIRAPDRLRWNRQQSHGEPDFDILDDTGTRTGVLEVTSAVDAPYTETLEALSPDNHGGLVVAQRCSRCWRVWPEEGVSVRRLRANLDDALATIEEAGLQEFDDKTTDPRAQAVAARLRLMRGRVEPDQKKHHVVNLPDLTRGLHPHALGDAIQAEAARPDNVRKLSEPTVGETHLFVHIDYSSLAAFSLFDHDFTPQPVLVDPSISHLWAARETGALWAQVMHAANGGQWMRHTVNWGADEEPPVIEPAD